MKTAECVTPKHPDKMCDQISDAILDYCLRQDSNARVAIETMGGHGKVYVTGEITIDSEEIMNNIGTVVNDIVHRITGKNEEVFINIVKQSTEIAQGVDIGGAGDQGIMIGYACNDNDEMVPQEYYLARTLCQFIYEKYPYDGKTQITLGDDGYISTVVASFQNVDSYELESMVNEWLDIAGYPHAGCVIHCNPAGNWNIGGFDADTGLTGRKLAVDNYGPQIPIGGGAFSGKDATKVDRSGAYMARRLAVDVLRQFNNKQDNKIIKEVMVKLAYAIGVVKPVMVSVEVDGISYEINEVAINMHDLAPKGMIETLELREPKFEETAKWGHFGNKFEWDK